MKHKLVRLFKFSLVIVLLSGCGIPSSVPTPTPAPSSADDFTALVDKITNGPHDTVTSSDGNAELLIPPGALPPGKTASDIKVMAIDPSLLHVKINNVQPVFAYQFEPDGLVFATPALIRITTIPSSDSSIPTLISVSGKEINLLMPSTAGVDNSKETLTITAPMNHFSSIGGYLISFGLTLSGSGDHSIDTSFDTDAVISMSKDSRGFVLDWSVEGRRETRTIEPSGIGAIDAPPRTFMGTNPSLTWKQSVRCDPIVALVDNSYYWDSRYTADINYHSQIIAVTDDTTEQWVESGSMRLSSYVSGNCTKPPATLPASPATAAAAPSGSSSNLGSFGQEYDMGATVTGYYESPKVPNPGPAPADSTCPPLADYNQSSLDAYGSGHSWHLAISNGKIFMGDSYDLSGFDVSSGNIASDGTFHLGGGGFRFDGTLQLAPGVTLPLPDSAINSDNPTLVGHGTFEQVWKVIDQPCFPLWTMDFRLYARGPFDPSAWPQPPP